MKNFADASIKNYENVTKEVNPDLKKYVEERIFPEYSKNDQGHGILHILEVIRRSFVLNNELNLGLNPNMIYTVAASHDLGKYQEKENDIFIYNQEEEPEIDEIKKILSSRTMVVRDNQKLKAIDYTQFFAQEFKESFENQCFEKLLLTINMKFCIDGMNTGVILALREEVNQPVIKKIILSRKRINENEKDEIIKRLNLTESERANLLKNGYWYPDISNNSGFKGV